MIFGTNYHNFKVEYGVYRDGHVRNFFNPFVNVLDLLLALTEKKYDNVQFFFINKLFVSFVNELKINVSLWSLIESSINFQKLTFVNGTLPSPRYVGEWVKSGV